MKEDHAQAIVDLIVVGLGAVAVVYVMRTPPLRRAVWRAVKYLALTAGPRIVWQETTKAWELSGAARGAKAEDGDSGIGRRESRIMSS